MGETRLSSFVGQGLEFPGGTRDVLGIVPPVLFAAIGPFAWMHRLLATGRPGGAGLVLLYWALSVVIGIVAVKRKMSVALPLGVFLAWLVVLAFALYDWIERVLALV